MTERHLLIDDLRNFNVDRTARNYDEGIKALQEEKWDVLWLDHDLGDPYSKEKTGYDILCWLEENPEYLPGRIELVTSNPAGRDRMNLVLNKLYGRTYG